MSASKRNMRTPLAKIKYESYVSVVLLLSSISLTTVDEMTSNITIYAASIAVRDALLEYNATSNVENKEWAEDMLADFNIWAYDSGACTKGVNSLDSRITLSVHVREVIVNMLSMLDVIIARLQAQVTSQNDIEIDQQSRTQPGFSSKDHRSNAADLLTEVARLTIAIEDAESQSKDTTYDNKVNLEDHQVLKLHLESMFVSPPKNNKKVIGGEDVSYAVESGNELTDVQKRLIEANLRRRSGFSNAHCRADTLIHMDQMKEPEDSTSTFKCREVSEVDVVPTAISADDISINVSELAVLEGSQALYDVNAGFSRSDGDTKEIQAFKCPWCCKTLPNTIKKETAWEEHLAEDISPYTCILNNCCSPSTTYQTRDSWKWHMITEHPPNKFWVCSACYTNTRFEEELDFSMHVEAQHMAGMSENDMSAIVFACARQAPVDFWSCPLCPEKTTGNTEFLLDHIADHLKSFSLQSLPIPSWQEEVTEGDFDPGYYLEHPEEYFAPENIDTNIPDEVSEKADNIKISAERKEPSSETKGSASNPKPITKAVTKLISTPVLIEPTVHRQWNGQWTWSPDHKQYYRFELNQGKYETIWEKSGESAQASSTVASHTGVQTSALGCYPTYATQAPTQAVSPLNHIQTNPYTPGYQFTNFANEALPSTSYNASPPLYNVQHQQPAPHWPNNTNTTPRAAPSRPNVPSRGEGLMVKGSYFPGRTSHYEALDSSFYVRDLSFFKEGKVFAVLFHEPAGANVTAYNSSISKVKFNEPVHSQIRRFVIVRARAEFCYACPIFTYNGRGTLKPGVRANEHAIAYSSPGQPVAFVGETGMTMQPICIVNAPNMGPLDPASRIYFGIHHPTQYNVKVQHVGDVQSSHLLNVRRYWNLMNQVGSNQAQEVTAAARSNDEDEEEKEEENDADPPFPA